MGADETHIETHIVPSPPSHCIFNPRSFPMTSWQIVRVFAGTSILASLALGLSGSPVFVSPWWLVFTAFVGANLLQSGFTRWCLLETLLRKLGARPGC